MLPIRRYDFLGINVDTYTEEAFLKFISETISSNGQAVIGNHNLHSVYLHHHDPNMRAFFRLMT